MPSFVVNLYMLDSQLLDRLLLIDPPLNCLYYACCQRPGSSPEHPFITRAYCQLSCKLRRNLRSSQIQQISLQQVLHYPQQVFNASASVLTVGSVLNMQDLVYK